MAIDRCNLVGISFQLQLARGRSLCYTSESVYGSGNCRIIAVCASAPSVTHRATLVRHVVLHNLSHSGVSHRAVYALFSVARNIMSWAAAFSSVYALFLRLCGILRLHKTHGGGQLSRRTASRRHFVFAADPLQTKLVWRPVCSVPS